MKQLFIFFVLACLVSWIIWLPLYGHIFGLTDLYKVHFNHALGGLGPLIAALLTTCIFLKNEGLKNILLKCVQIKPLIYFGIALLSPFIFALIALLIGFFVDQTPINFSGLLTTKEFPQFNLLTYFIYNLFFFGFGEEVGWRGFALPRLQNKFNALNSCLILTAFWALWHLPLFFYRPGYTTMDMAGIVGWIFSLVTGSILLTWMYNSSRASILICAVFHSTIDIVFTTDIAEKNVVNYIGALISIWGIVTIMIFKPKKLSLNNKETM